MGLGLNTTSDISGYIQTIYDDALFVFREMSVMPGLVTTFTDQSGDQARSSSEYGTVNVNSVGESDDLTSQAFTPSVLATLTPGEYGAQFFLSDRRIRTDKFNVQSDAAQELGSGFAEKIDTDVAATFSSLTGGTVGAAGSAMTWGYFGAAQSILRARKVPGPYIAVLHPFHYHDLAIAASIASPTAAAAPALTDEVSRNFYVGRFMGVDTYISANIATDGSDDAVSAMYSRQAIALDMRLAPRLEPERDASRRGWELNMTAVYAAGVWRPRAGVKIVADATTPS